MTYFQADITVPYAVANFAEIRRKGYYYVDKTNYIPLLERYKAPVFLRPRRFGKSLLISMLAHYYDRNMESQFHDLFDGTWIGNQPTQEHHQYMVVRYDFSTTSVAGNLSDIEKNFNAVNCSPLHVLVEKNKDLFGDFHFQNEGNASNMLVEVLNYIAAHDLPPLYILIDEYDNFANQLLVVNKDNLYQDLTTGESFLRTFFKVIKAGIGEGTIRTCFCLGVLPVTMDDLTSGYNIAEMLTLKPEFTSMLGFTHDEAAKYLRYVIAKYGPQASFDELWTLILNNYDGYHFLPDAEPLFNSTILTYFFKNFAELKGGIPMEMVDENLRTDTSWIRRLTITLDNAKEMLDALLLDGELFYSQADLRSKFNKTKFFSPEFYPISLYYLGMTTLKDNFKMVLPNLTTKSVYMSYYNELNSITDKARKFVPVYDAFATDRKLEPLFYNYVKEYLGVLPAQVFDKMNENFIRCSFFELLSRYLSSCYTFAIEQNLPSGRADLVMTGIPGSAYHNDCRIIEFKYLKSKDAALIEKMLEPHTGDAKQVLGYAADMKKQFPMYEVKAYVAYIAGNKAAKIFLL